MVNQQILDYIQREFKEGYAAEQIRPALLEAGYDANEVEEALQLSVQNPKPAQQQNANIKKRNPILVAVLPFLTFFIYGLYWVWSTATALKKSTNTVPHPLLMFIPVVNFFFFWKFFEGVHEVTNYSNVVLFLLWFFFPPAAFYLTQEELNKVAAS